MTADQPVPSALQDGRGYPLGVIVPGALDRVLPPGPQVPVAAFSSSI